MQSATPDDRDEPLADYRQYYGLTNDPFRDDPDFPFFGGGGRRALLEQLQHLCQFSASLLAVLGKPGAGKSRMALELANSFGAEDEVCLLNAEPGAGASDILAHMSRHFALPMEEGSSVGRLLAALRHFAQVADEEDRLALTIIDDAHHLDEQTLGALISLLQGQEASGRRLHIVLFAEPDMVRRLDQFNMHDVLIHDFEMAPLSLEEAADYLNFRMEMSDYMGPEVFTETKVEPWWHRAEGRLPGLHERAHQYLLESVTPDTPARDTQRGSPLPLMHIVVVAVLLGVLLMVFLYGRGDGDSPGGASPEVNEVASQTDNESTAGVAEGRSTQTLTLPTAQDEPASSSSQSSPALAEQAVSPADGTTLTPSAQAPEAVETAAPDTVNDTPERQEVERVETPAAQETPAARAEPEPQPSVPDIPDDEQMLLSWRSAEYTLQLLGAGTRASVERYVSEQSNRQQLLTFESRRQGKPWFVVVTGRYASAAEARSAVESLPAGQREAGPWPRSVGEIQSEIEEQHGL